MRLRGKNPIYSYADYDQGYDQADSASYLGVATKTSVLLGIIAIVAMYTMYRFAGSAFNSGLIIGIIVAPIIAIIAVVVAHRVPTIAMFATIVYALCEGMFLGFVSALYASYFGNEIIQMALIGTFGVLGGMLLLYSTGLIRVGAFFRRLMMSMLIGLIFAGLIIAIVVLAGGVGETFMSFYTGIVVISVIVSSLFLLIDFDNITRYVQAGVPRNMEWSLALGLVVTIVWIYIELLRFLAIVASRRR